MHGAHRVEVKRAGQQGGIAMLQGQHHAQSHLEDEQDQHEHEEAQAETLRLIFGFAHGV